MRKRYVVMHAEKPVGWVHAATAEEAVQKVCKVTGTDPKECTAVCFHIQKPTKRT